MVLDQVSCHGDRCASGGDVQRRPPDGVELEPLRPPDRGARIGLSVEELGEATDIVVVDRSGCPVDRLHPEIIPYVDACAGSE